MKVLCRLVLTGVKNWARWVEGRGQLSCDSGKEGEWLSPAPPDMWVPTTSQVQYWAHAGGCRWAMVSGGESPGERRRVVKKSEWARGRLRTKLTCFPGVCTGHTGPRAQALRRKRWQKEDNKCSEISSPSKSSDTLLRGLSSFWFPFLLCYGIIWFLSV